MTLITKMTGTDVTTGLPGMIGLAWITRMNRMTEIIWMSRMSGMTSSLMKEPAKRFDTLKRGKQWDLALCVHIEKS